MFNQIKYFIAVVKNKNFTKAAEECNISQPAISQQIKELEAMLGTQLLQEKMVNGLLSSKLQVFINSIP